MDPSDIYTASGSAGWAELDGDPQSPSSPASPDEDDGGGGGGEAAQHHQCLQFRGQHCHGSQRGEGGGDNHRVTHFECASLQLVLCAYLFNCTTNFLHLYIHIHLLYCINVTYLSLVNSIMLHYTMYIADKASNIDQESRLLRGPGMR